MTTNDMPAKNTDRELWRESDDRSQCTPSIHVTQDGGIGISVGGTVITRTLREWHELANGPRIPFIAPNGMTSPVAADVAKIACATPIIAKQRNGWTGTIHLTFIKERCRFENKSHVPD